MTTLTALDTNSFLAGLLGKDLAAQILAPSSQSSSKGGDAGLQGTTPTAQAAMDQILLSPEAQKLLTEYQSARLLGGIENKGGTGWSQVIGDHDGSHQSIIGAGTDTSSDGHTTTSMGVYDYTQHQNDKGQATTTMESLSIVRDDTGALNIRIDKTDLTYFGGNDYDHSSLDIISIGADGKVSVEEKVSDTTFYTPDQASRSAKGSSVDVKLEDGANGTTMTASEDGWREDITPGKITLSNYSQSVKVTRAPGGASSVTTNGDVALQVIENSRRSSAEIATSQTTRMGGDESAAVQPLDQPSGNGALTDPASIGAALAKVSMTA